MDPTSIAGLVKTYGWSGTIAVLAIVGLIWLFVAAKRGCGRVWADIFPMLQRVVERHICFIDATSANMQKQAEAIELLAEKIQQMGLATTQIDKIHDNVKSIVNCGCGRKN